MFSVRCTDARFRARPGGGCADGAHLAGRRFDRYGLGAACESQAGRYGREHVRVQEEPCSSAQGANHRPVAVLKRNRVAFYVVEPGMFEAMMDEFADQELCGRAASRLADKSRAIEVDIDEL